MLGCETHSRQWYGDSMEIPAMTDWYYNRSRVRITPPPLHFLVGFCACGSNHMVQSAAKHLASPQSTADLAEKFCVACSGERKGPKINEEMRDRSKGRQSPISPFVKADVTAVASHRRTPGRYGIPDQFWVAQYRIIRNWISFPGICLHSPTGMCSNKNTLPRDLHHLRCHHCRNMMRDQDVFFILFSAIREWISECMYCIKPYISTTHASTPNNRIESLFSWISIEHSKAEMTGMCWDITSLRISAFSQRTSKIHIIIFFSKQENYTQTGMIVLFSKQGDHLQLWWCSLESKELMDLGKV